MRHQKRIKKLGRTAKHRQALMKNMLTSLFKYERITTTVTKAKVARSLADGLITTALKGTLASKRKIISYLTERDVAHKLIGEIAPRYADNPTGGYTRVLKLGPRKNDAAEMAILELVNPADKEAREKPKVKRKAKSKATSSRVAKDTEQKKPVDETAQSSDETAVVEAEETKIVESTPQATNDQTETATKVEAAADTPELSADEAPTETETEESEPEKS